jgi:8-oxo-dGTP pyrophosphatase MutT (NUDIX family)
MNKYRKAVFIVTYRRENKKIFYLVLKRKLHWTGWEFPKGAVNKRETPLLTVIRELKEETGQSPVTIKRYNAQGKYNYEKKYPDRKGIIGQTWQLFSAEIKSSKINLDKKEHSAYKWLNYKEAVNLVDFPEKKKSLEIVNKSLG